MRVAFKNMAEGYHIGGRPWRRPASAARSLNSAWIALIGEFGPALVVFQRAGLKAIRLTLGIILSGQACRRLRFERMTGAAAKNNVTSIGTESVHGMPRV